jgi:hypothetical protein
MGGSGAGSIEVGVRRRKEERGEAIQKASDKSRDVP